MFGFRKNNAPVIPDGILDILEMAPEGATYLKCGTLASAHKGGGYVGLQTENWIDIDFKIVRGAKPKYAVFPVPASHVPGILIYPGLNKNAGLIPVDLDYEDGRKIKFGR